MTTTGFPEPTTGPIRRATGRAVATSTRIGQLAIPGTHTRAIGNDTKRTTTTTRRPTRDIGIQCTGALFDPPGLHTARSATQ
jgi:hypothetical protein